MLLEELADLLGSTIPAGAKRGTIRGDFSKETVVMANREKQAIRNFIHASGDAKEDEEEIKLWFRDEGISLVPLL